MSIGSINSHTSIAGLDNLSGTNSTQGIYKGHAISIGNNIQIPITSSDSVFPSTSLVDRQAVISHR